MGLLHFLPDAFLEFVVNAVLFAGIASTVITFVFLNLFLRWIPGMAMYYRLAQVISIAILTLGVYFKGGYATEQIWRERVAEVERQLEEARKESAKVNTVIQEKIVEKVKVVKEKADTEIKYIDRVVKEKEEIIKYVEQCPIPQELIDLHNRAATMGGKKP